VSKIANSNRDAQGRWSSANIAAHTPDDAANGGAPNIADAPTATRPGAAGPASFSAADTPAARGAALSISDGSADDWGAADLTGALLDRPVGGGGGGGGMGEFAGADKPEIPDYEAGFNKLRFDGPDLGREAGEAFFANHQGQKAVRAAGRDAAMRAGGYGGPEGPGTHRVSAPGGPAYHGADVPGGGMPRPGDYGGAPGGGPRDWSPNNGGTPGLGDGTIDLQQGEDGVWGAGG
jgi:hypothetical protein